MKNQKHQQTSDNNPSITPPKVFTLRKFAEKHSEHLTLPGITNLVFKAKPRQSSQGVIPGNGMLEFGVIKRIGRKVLIVEPNYFRWMDSLQDKNEG